MKDFRSRLWTFVGYPDSLPENYLDILNDLHINVVISPLHDKDLNPTGEEKKSHYHFLMCFETLKSFEQVKYLIKPLKCTIPQVCHNKKGMVRYFVHMDNPEKYQYNKCDIRLLGYDDLEQYFEISFTERNVYFAEMFDFIKENKILEFADFIDYCRLNRCNDWLPLLTNSGSVSLFNLYIRSNNYRFKLEEEKKHLTDYRIKELECENATLSEFNDGNKAEIRRLQNILFLNGIKY